MNTSKDGEELLRTVTNATPAAMISVGEDMSERQRAEERLVRFERLNHLKEDLLAAGTVHEKLRRITDAVIEIFDADFARIWVTKPGDLCDAGCFHAGAPEGRHVCRRRERCLHLMASSGRYTHIDGEVHRRVPLGCYKIGQIATAEEARFVTNDVTHDSQVHNPAWARALGLVSFAGYRLLSPQRKPIGVLALFSKHRCSPDDDALLETVATTAAHVIQTAMAEEALRKSSAELAALAEEQKFILDNMRDFVYRHDSKGIFYYLSPAVEHVTGYTVEDWKKHYTTYLTDNPINEKVVEYTERTLRTGKSHPPYLVELHHKNGSRIMLEVSERPYYEDGNVAGIVGIARDISERKRAEEERRALEAQMQHAQKLESLGVLAGGIAHDFNNLLVGVLGNASLALEQLSPESPARRAVEQIEQAGQRAADLTRQMLAYSGKGAFVVEPVDLSKLVEEMAHLLEAVTSKKAIRKYDFPEDLPLVEVDATQVRQVVMNLITNASEALGRKSGVIAIRTGVMEADRDYLAETWPDDDLAEGIYVFVEVTDTGCGMDEATLAKLFDPFFTTKFTGRGLGLAAVLGIVRGHRGAIKIRSGPGRGSTFRVLFQASERSPAPVREEPPPPEKAWATGVILVADDEEVVRTTHKLALEDMGFTVLTAADGRQALNVFRERHREIDVVLLDLTMPHLGGEEVFREMRRLRSDVRVILSSGYSKQEALAHLDGADVAGFLQKPFGIAALAEKLRRILTA